MDSGPARSNGAAARPRLGIRARLIVFMLCAAGPLAFDRAHELTGEQAKQIGTARQKAVALAGQAAETQKQIVTEARTLLRTISRLPEAAPDRVRHSGEAQGLCAETLQTLNDDLPWANGLWVADPDGRIVCATVPRASGLDISDRLYFRQALETKRFVLSDYITGRKRGQPAVVAAQPRLGRTGDVEAVFLATLDLRWLGKLAASVGQDANASVTLLDGAGTVLASYPSSDAASVGRNLAETAFGARVLAQDEGWVEAAGPDGEARIFGFTRLPGTGAHVAVGLPRSEVLAGVERQTGRALGRFGAVLLLLGAMAWIGGHFMIVRPARAFAAAAARFGVGDFSQRIAARPWTAECAIVAQAFDAMADRLAARETELKEANARLEALAETDGLTGLANRRRFNRALDEEWRRAGREDKRIVLIFLDVDYFKAFNDRYGHPAGDECLKRIAGVLQGFARRASDTAARCGGEEFALLLPGADERAAHKFAERVRAAVEALGLEQQAPSGRVTVSVGVAAADPRHGSAPALVASADAALYEAKREGRNRVAQARPPGSVLAA